MIQYYINIKISKIKEQLSSYSNSKMATFIFFKNSRKYELEIFITEVKNK